MKLTNGNAKLAMIWVGILTLALLTAAVVLYVTASDGQQERTALFIGVLGTMIGPTVASMLSIAQGKELADKIDDSNEKSAQHSNAIVRKLDSKP